jgi:hypothetical protein
LGRISRNLSAVFLFLFSLFITARAQAVIPRVCVDAPYQSGTTTLVANDQTISVSDCIPLLVGNRSLGGGQTLAAGSHTVKIRTRCVIPGSSPAFVIGNSTNSLLRGQLTVAIVKK